jgi:SAM-dependent methyltransferase
MAMTPTPDEARAAARATWSAGDYPEIGKTIEDCSLAAVEASGVAEGETLLDVATGSGNAALEAARRGARVTGLDITPELLEAARRRAADEGLEIEFDEGDAAALPYDDGSFDRVVSVFGAMFAPDQAGTAAELMRVCRPGGTIVIAAWTPDGVNGQLFRTVATHMPPPPEGFQPPVLWGTEGRIRELFEGAGVDFRVLRAENNVDADSIDEWLDHIEALLGPIVLAKAALEPEGKWDAARADLAALYERNNEADDGRLQVRPEYLQSVITKPA